MKNVFGKGMIFTAIGQYSSVIIQLIINVVLSRLLEVNEFGVIATVQVFLVFFQTLVTSGFGPAIIQNKSLNEHDYISLRNYLLLFSLILAVGFGFLGIPVASIYGAVRYQKLFWAMSIIVFSEGLKVVPMAILNKELKFKTINMTMLFANVFGAIAGITAAFMGAGIYSLIISTAIPSMLTMIVYNLLVKIPYRFDWNTKALQQVWFFARNQLGFTFLNYFSRNTDNLLIGKFIGASALANYQKGYQLITMPNTIFLGVITPVLQPILSKDQENYQLIRDYLLKIVHVLALIAFPLTAFMAVNSEPIILFLFGNKWNAAIVPFTILALSIWAQMLTSVTGSIFMARDRSQDLLLTGAISTFLILAFTILGIVIGSTSSVAACVTLAYTLNFFSSYFILMKRVLFGALWMVIKEIIVPAFIGVGAALLLLLFNTFIKSGSNFITLLINGIVWLCYLFFILKVSGELKKVKELFSKG